MRSKVRPIKLEDLAKKLKVSKVTISKALRGHPDISPETTEKVKELAEKLGYTPNVMARNLSARKSNTIGLVVPKIAHLFFSSIIESVYDTAFKNNYETLLTISQEKADREKKHILSLLAMKVDGLIISITQETEDLSIFQRVMDLNIPIVFVDRVPKLSGVSSVTVDDKGGAYSAIEFAAKKGYKKIAHVGGYNHINIGKFRCEGFNDAMKDYNIPIHPEWVVEGGFGEQDGYEGFMKIFKTGKLPEFILAVTYPVALGIYSAAKEAGVKIPEDIEVTCFGYNLLNRYTPSIFNFVSQPAQELGREAVNLILEKINYPKDSKPKNIQLKTYLHLRNPNLQSGLVA
ncbi:MAG TPA: LacI family DNA-binding transcriptional regulator [Ignavibacteriaceae bacterium]|nr:LacI family DNA-binding transcriptional regulator [Ignavibacteriaceae bacterium]